MKWNGLPLEDSLSDFTASLYLCLCWVGWNRVNFYTARMAYPEITKRIFNTILSHAHSHRGGAGGGRAVMLVPPGVAWSNWVGSFSAVQFGAFVFWAWVVAQGKERGWFLGSSCVRCDWESVLAWAAIGSPLTFSEGRILFSGTAMWIGLRCVNIIL